MKKLLCILTAMFLLAAGCALAEDIWDFNTNDYALNGYSGAGGDVVIPNYIHHPARNGTAGGGQRAFLRRCARFP